MERMGDIRDEHRNFVESLKEIYRQADPGIDFRIF